MTVISGVACVFGAAIICADVVVCRFPGMKDFRVQNSDAFLSASLSLSFGVMLFSSTYNMLPSAKESLVDGGMSSKAASWVLILCFIVGAVGIQILSRILHHFIPSHVVDCEHSHDDHGEDHKERHDGRAASRGSRRSRFARKASQSLSDGWPSAEPDEERQQSYFPDASTRSEGPTCDTAMMNGVSIGDQTRPSIPDRVKSTLSKLSMGSGDACKGNSHGACRGFTETCGHECFKIIQSRGSANGSKLKSVKPVRRATSAGDEPPITHTETTPLLNARSDTLAGEDQSKPGMRSNPLTPYDHAVLHRQRSEPEDAEDAEEHASSQHHHHVPNNAFLSIGLQTSLAIALHKLPEGFITYATNHANPQLGFSVFLALFIHNITEGFALALPLFLALRSRFKAMAWAFLLGGCSQPLGAGIAALWFAIAGNSKLEPGERVYGGMFAATAGIMTSVALQLFSESLDLTHNRQLCMMSAFAGMGIMGISAALTA